MIKFWGLKETSDSCHFLTDDDTSVMSTFHYISSRGMKTAVGVFDARGRAKVNCIRLLKITQPGIHMARAILRTYPLLLSLSYIYSDLRTALDFSCLRLSSRNIVNCYNSAYTTLYSEYCVSCSEHIVSFKYQANVEGKRCNKCRVSYFNLDSNNPDGCMPCFCFGVTSECKCARGYRDKVQ